MTTKATPDWTLHADRITVPVVLQDLLTPMETDTLRRLEIDPDWMAELTLYYWLTLQEDREDVIYNSLLAEVGETHMRSADYADVNSPRMQLLAHSGDLLIDIFVKYFRALKSILGNMAFGRPDRELESITVAVFHRSYTVLQFNYIDYVG